jgi:hypothetical protein
MYPARSQGPGAIRGLTFVQEPLPIFVLNFPDPSASLSMAYTRPKPPAGGIKVAFPGFIEPALAKPIDKVPSGDR